MQKEDTMSSWLTKLPKTKEICPTKQGYHDIALSVESNIKCCHYQLIIALSTGGGGTTM